MLLLLGLIAGAGIWQFVQNITTGPTPLGWLIFMVETITFIVVATGFFTLQPNEARVLVLFGSYRGTVRKSGFH